MQVSSWIEGWMRERFPRYPNIYFGVSGATLVGEALQTQHRSAVLLSAFICPAISAMAWQAGKQVVHVDADPDTLLPDQSQLEQELAAREPGDTVLLMDHSFGYPYPDLASLRRRFPGLLIVEDCARALGTRIRGQLPGADADWLLLSMYKTVRGSQHGAVLLTRTPVSMKTGVETRSTLRERAANLPVLRQVYDFLKRSRPQFDLRAGGLSPDWAPAYGLPSQLCFDRFAAELQSFDARSALRQSIAGELNEMLSEIPGVECTAVAPGCRAAGQFVSVRMRTRRMRDSVLTRLHRKGLFLSRTWDLLPAHYRCFSQTFPSGHAGADRLGELIAHVPVNLFFNSHQRRLLATVLHNACAQAELS